MGVSEAIRTSIGAESHPALSRGTAQQIRGSSVLLLGRLFALALNFGSQILLVRYLSKTDFGAFSYALAVVALLQGFVTFEMSTALSRWVPYYRENRQFGALYGSVAIAFGFVAAVGLLVSSALVVGFGLFDPHIIDDPQARRLLAVLAVLIPIQSLDSLVTSLFAILGNTRAILIRGSILAPGLRIVLVAGLIVFGADVISLALGYLAISAAGLLFYVWTLWRTLINRGLLHEYDRHKVSYPVREIFGFASPLVVTVLVWSLMESSDAILLGYFHGIDTVASFRAVLPLAVLNKTVILTFGALYLPAASRLYARGKNQELSEMYWQTAAWMTALSFPIFLCTFSFARPVTLLLFGSRYLDSAPVLSVLSLGYFFHTALGFNGLTLKTFNKLRVTVSIDIAAAFLNVGVNLLTIPRWGVLGAAVGTCTTMIVHNALKQIALWKYTGISGFSRRYLFLYGGLFGVPLAMFVLQTVFPQPLWIALPVGAAAGLAVFWNGRHVLSVHSAFPELEQWRWWRLLRRVSSFT